MHTWAEYLPPSLDPGPVARPTVVREPRAVTGDTTCCICLQRLTATQTILSYCTQCGHIFHAMCIFDATEHTPVYRCPMCRAVDTIQGMPATDNFKCRNKNGRKRKHTSIQ